jgi:hypothetical protein
MNDSSPTVHLPDVFLETNGKPKDHMRQAREFLFEGTKAFWKIRCTIDFFIKIHEDNQNCLEVIAFNASTGCESNHIYLDYEALSLKVPDLIKILEVRKEIKDDLNRSFNLTQETHVATINFIIQYVKNRISVVDSSDEALTIELQPNYSDIPDPLTGRLDTEIEKPATLVPTVLHCKKIVP